MKRKEIIEHPFGTIKRNLGYTYFLVKGLEMVKSEFSLICFTYNFKRVLNIFGVDGFLKEIERQKQLKLAENQSYNALLENTEECVTKKTLRPLCSRVSERNGR